MPLAIGRGLAGYSIGFSYSGAGTPGTPGTLRYEAVDADTFATLYSGLTTSAVVPVPEPASAALLPGLGTLAGRRRAGSRSPHDAASRSDLTGVA